MSLAAGEKLGPYEILAPIGAGGMGEVYRAHDPRLNRNVAITTSPSFQAGVPKPLFTMPANVGPWDVTADGKRFLAVLPVQSQQTTNTPITVVTNWEAGLKK